MKTAGVGQMQQIDRIAIEDYGIPSLALMENAGRAVAGEVITRLAGKRRPRVIVICGPGNNGGDGFVAARHLANAGVDTGIFLLGQAAGLSPDARIHYGVARHCGIPVRALRRVDPAARRQIRRADMVVDAIFGIGLNREIGQPFREVIELVNISGKQVAAVDIPSGLDGTTGKVWGVCVRAAVTVTFACAKKGFFKNDGPKVTGKVMVVDIGIPGKIVRRLCGNAAVPRKKTHARQ